ncbi:MAG: ATP-binding protein [Candidatus Onthomonas sp.]
MTALEVFEELRFIWELIGAEFVFLLPFAQPKARFVPHVILGAGALSLISMGYFWLRELDGWLSPLLFQSVICSWYIFLALLTMLYLRACFQLTFHNALYMCIAGYAAQHLVYIGIHEVLALGVWPELTGQLFLYLLISLVACVIVYTVLYRIFARQLSLCGGRMFEDNPASITASVLLLIVLMSCTFTCQHIFRFGGEMRYYGAALDVLICMLILGIQYVSFRMALSSKEQAVIEQILRNSKQYFAMSREMIELVNRNCHDMKHHLQALKLVGDEERQAFIQETEQNIQRYHILFNTDNEVLNTILAEKGLCCDSHQIRLSCALDGTKLDFISAPDLYALLGNAIDNAVECVKEFSDPEKRVISLTIQSRNAFVSIQTNNYYEGSLQLLDGLPITTKGDLARHGYGLKSIRYLARKYGGSMCVETKDHIFTLQVMLPIQT